AETPNPDVLWARNGHRTLLVDSDTDVEEEGPNPDVGPQKLLKMTQNVPETPDMGLATPNPDAPWLQNGCRMLVEESDTDVEEEKADPDVESPKQPKVTQNIPETPDVVAKTPNPDVPGPKISCCVLGSPWQPLPQVRRSQRLAKSRGGGASAGSTPTQKEPYQEPKPRPSPRPRPQSRREPAGPGLEQATLSIPIKGDGRGSSSAPPPQEEEPAEGAKRSLRPRAVPGPAQIRVLFTGLVASPALLVALRTLGGTEATSATDCTHLVTDGIRRTLKFLCALGRGIPIVTPQWLLQ
ncbi:MDC1 protein, partial [Cisticola juncidis]|nr:MDC1 protein [Cisticola juncidis]